MRECAAPEHPVDHLGVGRGGLGGPVDSTTAPTSAEYDWIRVYRYVVARG
jgi:hypothetical protein